MLGCLISKCPKWAANMEIPDARDGLQPETGETTGEREQGNGSWCAGPWGPGRERWTVGPGAFQGGDVGGEGSG